MKRHSGFTLIELLVVLAIVGAVSAVVAPNLWSSYQRSSERQQVSDYALELMAIRRSLHRKGQALNIPEGALVNKSSTPVLLESIKLPGGWTFVSNSQIYFLPTGVTNGGRINFYSATGKYWELELAALDGRISINEIKQ